MKRNYKTGFCIHIFLLWLVSTTCSIASHDPHNDTRLVCEIQERLASLGHAPGPIDGKAGKKTKEAVGIFLNQIGQYGKGYSPKEVVDFLRSYSERLGPDSKNLSEVPSLERPNNGRIYNQNSQNAIAPLEIKTAKQGYDYYIKISEVVTNNPVKTVYLRSGASIQTKVPLGNFMLKYATGENWLGENCLFGLETRFNKADRDFKFEQIGNQLSGYTIELIVQKDGNLATQRISAEEW